MNRRTVLLCLFAVFLLSFAVRVYHLGGESIWLDEMSSVRFSRLSWAGIVEGASQDVHPPLYYLLLKSWTSLFGDSEKGVRSFSVLLGLLSVISIFFVGTRLFDRRGGLLAAFLMGLSVFQIHYSQEARGYALLCLLTLLSFHFFLLSLEQPTLPHLGGWGICCALSTYTHVFGLFVPVAMGAALGIRFLPGRTRPALRLVHFGLGLIVIGILFLPWAAVLRRQIAGVVAGFWISGPSILSVPFTFLEFSGSFFLLPLLGIPALYSLKEMNRTPATLFLLCWLTVPIAAAFLVSLAVAPIYVNKALIGAAPAYYLLCARGISLIPSRRLASGLLLVITAFSMWGLYSYYTEVNREPWREAAATIKAGVREGDVVLYYAGYCRDVMEYYAGPSRGEVIQFPSEGGRLTQGMVRRTLSRVQTWPPRRVWLVLAHADGLQGLIGAELLRTRSLRERRKFEVKKNLLPGYYTGIEIDLYEPVSDSRGDGG